MAVFADFRVCLFDPLHMRIESIPHVANFHVRCGARRLNLVKRTSVARMRAGFIDRRNSLVVLQGQRRLCSMAVDSADHQNPAEPPQAARLAEVTTVEDAETSDTQNGATSPEPESQLLSPNQLAAFRSDTVRSRLLRKLSEANQFNRHLLRQVAIREKVIQQSKQKISALELELGVLVKIAQEIAKEGGKPGTRKINGRYIHSHLAVRLEEFVCALLYQFETWGGDDNLLTESATSLASDAPELQQTLLKQLETIEGVRSREVEIVYYGMAENVVVMGSFDNWSHGEAMSPEVTGTFTKFTATLKLLPGRYELKFMVDGEWRLSNFLPIIGEGVTMNNLLVVD
ncbi:hypothetical protein R1sor_001082 [Riccia sorocarpa]|uniref:AMP-activated protein kinase glycogen-binding domain-containing protein n=1 Tax=Riccia sorocarpa TaxID=122646 RepID=A0ABD3GY36_9MARC